MSTDTAAETAAAGTITLELDLPRPPEKVWRALTDADLLGSWLMKNDFLPVVGHRFTFRAEPGPHWDGIVRCEVLVVEPPKRLSYAWRSGTDLDTVATWTLTATKTGTHLVLTHAGFLPQNKFSADGARQGWEQNLLPALARSVVALG